MKLFAREHWRWVGVAGQKGTLEGYASFSHQHRSPGGDQKLVVHELTAARPSALRALLEVLGRQRDQVTDVELTVPYGNALAFAFEDAAGRRASEHRDPIGTMSAGPMVRMVDLHRALSLRGYAVDGDLTIGCTDASSPASVRLLVEDGIGQVLPAEGNPGIELSSATLGSIVASGIRPTEAAEVGLLQANSAALATAEEMFSGPRFQCLDPF
jgi:predicted acetyltransferase